MKGKARKPSSRHSAEESAPGNNSLGPRFRKLGQERYRALAFQMHTVESGTVAILKSEACGLASALERKLERTMLSRCANLQCSKPFLQLGQGKLFLIETGCVTKLDQNITSRSVFARHAPRRVERYWLCDQCSQVWTLIHDHNQRIGLFPLPQPANTA